MINDEQFNRSDDSRMVMARYDYASRTEEDIGFKKGELLCILDSENEDWWLAQNSSNEKGFIPSSYVMDHQSLDGQK